MKRRDLPQCTVHALILDLPPLREECWPANDHSEEKRRGDVVNLDKESTATLQKALTEPFSIVKAHHTHTKVVTM